ncbi:STAS domain-containing protein [Alkalihalophilus pseudofirmus]|uniref:STAS domain-containing protein n=1 Tax=Alkalihalophilus pseudofirmus TaxID=79885 RepID=A0AAJ2U4E9_ALKPS|nr:STAS domain-containing protein [Alkalihalophilus pseudofirmus]MDV2887056.1 STAS domain-containing protein [Alkalihalophilus pseudofirmus]
MHQNRELYDFLKEHSHQISEEWYASIDEQDPGSIYASNNQAVVNELRSKNHEYVEQIIQLFIHDECEFYNAFKAWSEELAKDVKHLDTPLHYVIREFFSTKKVLLSYIKKYAYLNKDKVDFDDIFSWTETVIKFVNISVTIFIEAYHQNTTKRFLAQEEIINELSSPLIPLQNQTALLPLVGKIDSARGKVILEKTLNQCAAKEISTLFIDLSGVLTIDELVAEQLYHLIESLRLTGVETILSGIRPEIAQMSIKLGLRFNRLTTASSLAKALSSTPESNDDEERTLL